VDYQPTTRAGENFFYLLTEKLTEPQVYTCVIRASDFDPVEMKDRIATEERQIAIPARAGLPLRFFVVPIIVESCF